MGAHRHTLGATLLTAALLAGGCGGGGGDTAGGGGEQGGKAAPKRGGTLRVLYEGDVDYIDPGITYYNAGYIVMNSLHRTVVNYKPDDPQHAVPDLAESLPQVSDDGRTVTIRIRAGVRFSPPVGRAVTAKDVKYALERTFFKTVNNGYAGTYFGDIDGARVGAEPGTRIRGIETPDARTVVLHLTRPTGGAVAGALALPASAPVPEEYAARYDAQNPSRYGEHQVATGPYMVANDAQGKLTGYKPGRSIHLIRNPNWDARTDYRPAYVDEVQVAEGNSDTTVASRRVLAGSHMLSGEFPAPAPIIAQVRKRQRDQLALVPTGGFGDITLNTAIAPFDDLNVRKAVLAGFDRNAIRLTAGGAVSGPFATHFIPPGIPGFEEAGGLKGPGYDFLANPEGDAALAASYMRKAGYASGRYEGPDRDVFVAAINSPDIQRQGEITQGNLERLGFKVRLRFVTADAFFTQICGVPGRKVNACVTFGWLRDFPDGQTILDPTFNGKAIQPQNNSNWAQLDVRAINAAMDQAESLIDLDARAKAWGDIDRQVTAQAPGIPTTWTNQALVRSRDVTAIASANLVGWDLNFAWLH
jgi:peptide/nickel transport system substrate-binding protein